MVKDYVFHWSLVYRSGSDPCLCTFAGDAEQNNLSREDYRTVQQNYRGWELNGFFVAGTLLSTLVLIIMVLKERQAFIFALIALLRISGTQVVFWTYTYPANQAINN